MPPRRCYDAALLALAIGCAASAVETPTTVADIATTVDVTGDAVSVGGSVLTECPAGGSSNGDLCVAGLRCSFGTECCCTSCFSSGGCTCGSEGRMACSYSDRCSDYHCSPECTFEHYTTPDGCKKLLLLGISDRSRVLFVVHAERHERIRIISARKATSHERKQYRG